MTFAASLFRTELRTAVAEARAADRNGRNLPPKGEGDREAVEGVRRRAPEPVV